jgi:hypothetical protein
METITWRFGTVSDPAVLEKPTLEPSELMGSKSMHRIKARKAHQASGLACGIKIPRAVQLATAAARDDLTDQYRLEKIALMKQTAAAKGNQVAINEIADVTKVRSIPLMPLATFNDKFKTFQRLMHRPPHAWEECSIQQLSAVEELLKEGVCYVDLSISGSNQQRSAKLMRVQGKVVGINGPLQNLEFKGPSDYFLFRRGFDVYACAMYFLHACMPPWLIAFADMAGRFNTKYGDLCWPLLWQCVDRFWHEQVPRVLRREMEQYEHDLKHSISRGSSASGPAFETARPFNYIWWLATTDNPAGFAEKTWWRENFIDNANIITDKAPLSAFIAGDAPIATGREVHFASLSQGERGSELSGPPAPGIHDGHGGRQQGKGGGRNGGGGKGNGKVKEEKQGKIPFETSKDGKPHRPGR